MTLVALFKLVEMWQVGGFVPSTEEIARPI